MSRTLRFLLATTVIAAAAPAGKKLTVKDLPPAVQRTVNDTLQGAEIKNIGKETEKGVTQYEVETMLNGKHRDFNVDNKGTLILVEEETSMDSIPAAAKATIVKKAGDGKLGMVETVTKPGEPVLYEASWTRKSGKRSSVLVKGDGSETQG